jgi:hypothetical protein
MPNMNHARADSINVKRKFDGQTAALKHQYNEAAQPDCQLDA